MWTVDRGPSLTVSVLSSNLLELIKAQDLTGRDR